MAYKKCLLCRKSILPTEEFVPYKGKYAHQSCFNKEIKNLSQDKKDILKAQAELQKNKKKKSKKSSSSNITSPSVIKDGVTEEQFQEKKRYYEYLKSLLVDEQLTVKQFAVSEKYIERYKFTFEGMYQTLIYLNEILKKELTGDIVGIIPYYYNEAESFQQDVKKLDEAGKNTDWSKLYTRKTIKIKPQKRKIKLMDIESVGK